MWRILCLSQKKRLKVGAGLHLLPWLGFVLVEGCGFPHEERLLRDPGVISQTGQEPVFTDHREAPLESCLVLLTLGLGADQVGTAQRLLGLVVLLSEHILQEGNSENVQPRRKMAQPERLRRDILRES